MVAITKTLPAPQQGQFVKRELSLSTPKEALQNTSCVFPTPPFAQKNGTRTFAQESIGQEGKGAVEFFAFLGR